MSVEASEGKIQHQPIYSFTYSLARSGSVLPERSSASLCCATLPQNKCCMFTGTHGLFILEAPVISESIRPGKGNHYCTAEFFFFFLLLIRMEYDFLNNHEVQIILQVSMEHVHNRQKRPSWEVVEVLDHSHRSFKIYIYLQQVLICKWQNLCGKNVLICGKMYYVQVVLWKNNWLFVQNDHYMSRHLSHVPLRCILMVHGQGHDEN